MSTSPVQPTQPLSETDRKGSLLYRHHTRPLQNMKINVHSTQNFKVNELCCDWIEATNLFCCNPFQTRTIQVQMGHSLICSLSVLLLFLIALAATANIIHIMHTSL